MLRSVLVTESARRALEPALARVPGRVPVLVCRAGHLAAITGFNLHRGCLALAERPAPTPVGALVAAARLVVALDAVGNADNVGGVFRNAAAFGVDGVLLGPTTCDPLYRKAIRTSMAATLGVPFARADDWAAALGALRREGFRIVALTPRDSILIEALAQDVMAFAEGFCQVIFGVRRRHGFLGEELAANYGAGEIQGEALIAGAFPLPLA